MTLYEGGSSTKELMFDASGTNQFDWFSYEKLTSSPWSDLSSEPRNFFTIQGDCHADKHCRSFLISRQYAGCGSDTGWMTGTTGRWCSWETNAARLNRVLYSKQSTYTNWNTNGELSSKNQLSPDQTMHDSR